MLQVASNIQYIRWVTTAGNVSYPLLPVIIYLYTHSIPQVINEAMKTLTYDIWFCCVCCCCCCCCCWINNCCCCLRLAVLSFSKRASISSNTLGVYRTTSLTLSFAAFSNSTAFSWCSPSTLYIHEKKTPHIITSINTFSRYSEKECFSKV